MSRPPLSALGAPLPARAAARAAWPAAWFTIRRLSGLVAILRACAIAFFPWSLRAITTAVEITLRPRGLVASMTPLKIGPNIAHRISRALSVRDGDEADDPESEPPDDDDRVEPET